MALAWVQDGVVTAGSGSPATAVIAISPAVGNVLCVAITQTGNNSGRTYAVTDNIDGATGWSQVKRNNPGTISEIWAKSNIPAGITAVTIAQTSTSVFLASISEFSGFGTLATADASDVLTESGVQNNHTCSALGLTSANPVVAFCACLLTASGATECNPGASYTEISPAFANGQHLRQYQIFPAGCASELGAWDSTGAAKIGNSCIALLSGNAAAGRTTKNTRANPLGVEVGMGWRMEP